MHTSDIKKLIFEVNKKIDLHENDTLVSSHKKNSPVILALKSAGNKILESNDTSIKDEQILNYFSLLIYVEKIDYFSSKSPGASLSNITHAFEQHLFPEGLKSADDAKKDLKARLEKMLNSYSLQAGFRTAATTVLAATLFSSGMQTNHNNANDPAPVTTANASSGTAIPPFLSKRTRSGFSSGHFAQAATAALAAVEGREKWYPKVIIFDFDLTATKQHTAGYLASEFEILDKYKLEKLGSQYQNAKALEKDVQAALKPGFLEYLHELNAAGTIIMFATVGSVENVIHYIGKAYEAKFPGQTLPLLVNENVFGRTAKLDGTNKRTAIDSYSKISDEMKHIDDTNKADFLKQVINTSAAKGIDPHQIVMVDDSLPKLKQALTLGMAVPGVTRDYPTADLSANHIKSENIFEHRNSNMLSFSALQVAEAYAQEKNCAATFAKKQRFT